MSYTQYIHRTWSEKSYELNVNWMTQKYEIFGDRIVFADISPWDGAGYVASVIVKDLPEPESQTEQQKIQL